MFEHVPHPHTEAKLNGAAPGPVLSADQLPSATRMARFNAWLGVKITNGVGTMYCAYCFAAIALISLPAAIATQNVIVMVSWLAQTFFQLVLLSIIIVGQKVLSLASDKRAQDTYLDAEAVLHEAVQIQAHLGAQDELVTAVKELIVTNTALTQEIHQRVAGGDVPVGPASS